MRNQQFIDLFINEDISGMASEEYIFPLIKLLSEKIRFFDKIVHYKASGITKGDFETTLYEVEGVIIGLLSEHYDLLPEVEQLLKVETPSDNHITKLKSLISRPRIFESFFNKLEHIGWFEPLRTAVFFKTPRRTKKHPGGGISSPLWPQCSYLKKCAPVFPEEVIRIVMEADDTDNWNVILEFAEIALLVPAKQASRLVKNKTDLWIKQFSPGNLPLVLARLTAYLAENGEQEAAKLGAQLLNLRRNPQIESEDEVSAFSGSERAVGYFDHHIYERVIKTIVPALMSNNARKTIELLCRALDSAISIQGPNRDKDPKNDELLFDRPTISDSEVNTYGNQYIKSLIDAIRDSLIDLERYHTDHAENCLELLRKYKPYIFLRIEMYILSIFSAHHVVRIEEIVSSPEIVRSFAVDYELDELLKTSYNLISKNARANYLKIVSEGPNIDE